MITIYGKNANAKVYTVADTEYGLESYARSQIQLLCDHVSASGSEIRVMPDVHPGKVGVIGLTMTVGDSILPSLVGVDIGCGMTLVQVKAKGGLQFQQLDTVIRENVPVGSKIRDKEHKYADWIDLKELRCYKGIDSCKAYKSIGTLGGGNHFLELDKDADNNVYLIVHSGSRHLGMEVADYYLKAGQKEAQEKKSGYAPYAMTCLSGKLMEDYLFDLKIIQEFARLNREAIVDTILKEMKWKEVETFSSIHNYIDQLRDVAILRKGAISARENEKVIIPINMRDGVILGTGLGNADWNYSAPHGAGRIYKRSEVADHYTVSDFKREMNGIHSVCITKDTLDESPFAYRKIDEILSVIGDTVKVDKIIKPVYNYKAGG